jgi:chemotaxis protein histidine kinase CheA
MADALSDDIETPIADDGIERSDDGAAAVDGVRALGFLLDEQDEEKVAKAVVKFRTDQNDLRSRNRATWKRSAWWREGRRGIRLDKKQDASQWEVKLPLGMSSAPPVPNKTDRLCRRVANAILVDKPFPDAEPGDDSNEARDAAEFATRYLTVKSSHSELNINRVLRSALDKSMTFGSAFGWVTMDPHGGGHRPRTMLAHPMATNEEDALTDPETGMEASEDQMAQRYLTPDGQLVDDEGEADIQWLPAPKVRILTGLQLDFLPATARGIEDAVGVVITDTTTLGDLKALFPDALGALNADKLTALCSWRPDHVVDLLPAYTKQPEDQKDDDGKFKDAQMVITTTVYYESCSEYPFGAYVVVGANTLVLHRQKWSATMQDQEGEEREEPLVIPVAQARCLDDDLYDNAYGIGIAEHLGPADEIRNVALGFEIEHMFRAANPIPMIPIGSIVQPKQFLLRNGEPVFTNPNGKPEWEQIPALSATVPALRQEMTTEMDDESGLQQAGQGVSSAAVQSGTHAQVIVQEALKAISNIKDNLGDFYVSTCQIVLQLTRAYCTVPQLLSYVGEDGSYKQKEWSRIDFRTTRRVAIARGSFTMHTLLAKQEMATTALQQQVIDKDEYMDLIGGGISPVLGMQDNPHLLRIRTQLDNYMDGPPEQWLQAMQQIQMQQAQAQQQQAMQAQAPQPSDPSQGAPSDPSQGPPVAQGSPQGPPMPPQAPAPQQPPNPFTNRLPVDLEPMPAKIRHRQLARQMAVGKFLTFPDPWKQVLLSEYMEMKNAAGIMTVPETQAAQQQAQSQQQGAAQQQQQAMQQMEQQKLQMETQKTQAEAQKIAQDSQAQVQQAQADQQMAMAKMQQDGQRLQMEQGAEQARVQLEQQKIQLQAQIEQAKTQLAQEAAARQERMDAAKLQAAQADAERISALDQAKLDLQTKQLEQKREDEAAQRQIELTFRTDELALRRLQLATEEERALREFQLKATQGTTAKPTLTDTPAPQPKPMEMVHERNAAGQLVRSVTRPLDTTAPPKATE